jgi:hypothetical protein
MTNTNTPDATPSKNPYLDDPDRPICAIFSLVRRLPNDITNARTLTLDQAQMAHAVAHYAHETQRTLMRGLAEIGKLMSWCDEECGDSMSPLGDLIQHLSAEAELMQDTAQDYKDAAMKACQ